MALHAKQTVDPLTMAKFHSQTSVFVQNRSYFAGIEITWKMTLSVSKLFILLTVLLRFCRSEQNLLACVRTLLRQENVKHLILVDQRSDSYLAPLFETLDWSVTTVTGLSSEGARHGSDILFATSVADIAKADFESIQLTDGRIYILLVEAEQSTTIITDVFSKFNAYPYMRSKVFVVANSGHVWRFYSFGEISCTEKNARIVEAIAQCDANGKWSHLRNNTQSNERHCPLIVAAAKLEPFSYYDESRRLFKGIDYQLVKTVAEHLRHDVSFVVADVESTKFVLYPSFMSRRLLKMLVIC